jgi:ankyrin repeat protein
MYHRYHKKEVHAIIKSGNLNQLEKYTRFDLVEWLDDDIFAYMTDDIIKHILTNCIDINCQKDGMYLIHYILMNCNTDVIKFAVELGINLEVATDKGIYPIHLAIENSSFEIIEYLINKNINLEVETNDGFRPIHMAIQSAGPKIIKYLIDRNVNLEAETKTGFCPFSLAIKRSSLEIIKYLDGHINLEKKIQYHGTDIDIVSESESEQDSEDSEGTHKCYINPICMAILDSTPEIIKHLISTNTINGDILDLLRKKKRDDIFIYLIDNKMNIQLPRYSLIHYIMKFDSKVIAYAIDNKFFLDDCSVNGKYPIHYFIRHSNHLEIFIKLINSGINLECEDFKKRRPIHYALIWSTVPVITLLMDKNINLRCRDADMLEPINYAIKHGHWVHDDIFMSILKHIDPKNNELNLIEEVLQQLLIRLDRSKIPKLLIVLQCLIDSGFSHRKFKSIKHDKMDLVNYIINCSTVRKYEPVKELIRKHFIDQTDNHERKSTTIYTVQY